MSRMSINRVCIAGNPNAGKSAIFNVLASADNPVGSWAGVTVEVTSKIAPLLNVEFIDLPGCYALRTTTSQDELEATNYLLLQESYDLIINVIDIAAFEKSLLLTLQLIELGKPIIVVLNKVDLVDEADAKLVQKKLSESLGITVIVISCLQNLGFQELIETLAVVDYKNNQSNLGRLYPSEIMRFFQSSSASYFADFIKKVEFSDDHEYLSIRYGIEEFYKQEIAIAILEMRYDAVKNISTTVSISHKIEQNNKFELIDKVLLNKFSGVPCFFLIMCMIFSSSINIGGFFQSFFEDAAEFLFIFGPLAFIEQLQIHNKLIHAIIIGIGSGCKTVIAFIPLIMTLYFLLSVLEESGYLSRAAFVMNKMLKKVGLSGSALIPIIMGFGCNVPAIMATRIIQSHNSRIAVILALPFMMCGARLSAFLILSSVFFDQYSTIVIFSLYLIGILMGIISLMIIKKSTHMIDYLGASFLIEIPDYQIPSLAMSLQKSFAKAKDFLLGAGKMIVIICTFIQILHSFSVNDIIPGSVTNSDSLLITIGKKMTYMLTPIGISENNWPATVGIISGLLAKEIVVGTLNSLYTTINLNKPVDDNLLTAHSEILELSATDKMTSLFESNLAVFCYMIFIMLYFPCVSVFAVTQKEIGTSWAVISCVWSTILAYFLAALIYQFGLYILDRPASLLPVVQSFVAICFTAIVIALKARKLAGNDTL